MHFIKLLIIMKRTFLFISLMVSLLAPSVLLAQESKYEASISKEEKIYNQQIGHHFGGEYFDSYTSGVRLFYGNRLSKHWMLGGVVGADVLKKTWEKDFKGWYSKMSVPVMAESRFYFGMSRIMPYLSADLGVHLSSIPTFDFWLGLGIDVNVYQSHTLFFSVGYGSRTPFDDMNALSGLGLFGRMGYYF